MSQEFEIHSEKEALACITLHFTEQEGLLAQIERGATINDLHVRMLEGALHYLQTVWKEKELVPKHTVRLFWNVIPRIDNCILLYPQRTDELSKLMSDLIKWFDSVFSTPRLSEEDAIALVSQDIFGIPSFSIELRFRKIRDDSAEMLMEALDVLAEKWKTREEISKLAAHAMISTQVVFMAVSDLFTGTQKKHLNSIEQQLAERIVRCLS